MYYIYMCVCIYIYIYIEREREREGERANIPQDITNKSFSWLLICLNRHSSLYPSLCVCVCVCAGAHMCTVANLIILLLIQ